MKKSLTTFATLIVIFLLPLSSIAYDKIENKCFNNLFAGLISIDNKAFESAKEYIRDGVVLSHQTQNNRLKAYSYLSLGLVYQKIFPNAKDIPARQKYFDGALNYLKNCPKLSSTDGFFAITISHLIDERDYKVTSQDFDQFYEFLRAEPVSYMGSLKLFILRQLSDESNQLENRKRCSLIGDYLYFSGINNTLKARNHVNIGLSARNIVDSESWKCTSIHNLNKALEYYYPGQSVTNKVNIPFQSPEVNALENITLTRNPDIAKNKIYRDVYVNDLEADRQGMVEKMTDGNCPNTPWACIEVSASAVKFSVICLRTERGGEYAYSFLKTSNKDVKISETDFNDYTIQQAFQAVSEYYEMASKEFSLPKTQIFIAFSSGLGDVARKNNKFDVLERLQKQIESASFTTNKTELLSVREEARLTLLGIVTADVRSVLYTAGILDIGTGNVKGGLCIDSRCNPSNFNSFNSSWALANITKQLTRNPDLSTPQNAQIFADEVDRFIKSGPSNEITTQFKSVNIRNKSQVFLAGGIFWAITSFLYPERVFDKEDSYIKIPLSDIINFKRIVINDYARYVNPQGYSEKISTGLRDVTSKFPQDKAIIGAILAEELVRDIQKSPIPKTYYYSKYSVVGWPTGYIIRQISAD